MRPSSRRHCVLTMYLAMRRRRGSTAVWRARGFSVRGSARKQPNNEKGPHHLVEPFVPPVHGKANEENASAFRGVGRVKGRMWGQFMVRRRSWLSHSPALKATKDTDVRVENVSFVALGTDSEGRRCQRACWRLARQDYVRSRLLVSGWRRLWGGALPLPSLDIARLDPDRIGATAAQYSKVQESSAL